MAGRNANGEGTIYRRKDGRYEAAVFLQTTSGFRKRVRVYGSTRAAVHTKLVEIKGQAARGVPLPDKECTLANYLDHWMRAYVVVQQRPATVDRNEQVIRRYLKPNLGAFKLSALSVRTVQTYLNREIEAGQSLATVHNIRKVLSAALTWAMRQELVFRNVARLVQLPQYQPNEAEPSTIDETRKFLRKAQGSSLYLAYLLLAIYGFRRGEVLGLQWDDIDLVERRIRVRRQLQRSGGELRLSDLKTAAGRRDVPIVGLIETVLLSHRTANGVGAPTQQLLFTTESGKPIEPRNFYRTFQRFCKDNGLRRIKVHDLRHTSATTLKNLGVPDRDIQTILGHADVDTTRRIYQHVSIDNQRDAIRQVERIFMRSVGGSVRCRQLLPSKQRLVDCFTRTTSGAVVGIRTRDPFLTIPNLTQNYALYNRLRSVDELLQAWCTQWQIGAVAVSVAVKTEAPENSG